MQDPNASKLLLPLDSANQGSEIETDAMKRSGFRIAALTPTVSLAEGDDFGVGHGRAVLRSPKFFARCADFPVHVLVYGSPPFTRTRLGHAR